VDGARKEIYLANEEAKQFQIYDQQADFRQGPKRYIKMSQPKLLAIAPGRKQIFVLDAGDNKIRVINQESGEEEIKQQIAIGESAAAMALTPDERKVYIGFVPQQQQAGGPTGVAKITVVDLETRQQADITGVNFPVSIAVTPSGRDLYVSTQGGAGHLADPVFVIDTRTNVVKKVIPNFDVGSWLLAPAGDQFYVVRLARFRGDSGKIMMVPYRHTDAAKMLNFSEAVSAISLTPNHRLLFAGIGSMLRIFDTETQQELNEIQLEGEVKGIAATNDWLYAWIPYPNTGGHGGRFFFRGLGDLMPVGSR
jgi:ABC-type uncharacterized transport system permease subunit